MQIIAEANPIISILIKPGKPIDLLFIEEIELVAPGLLFHEIESHTGMILRKSGLSGEELVRFIEILKERIKVIPEEEFLRYRDEAEEICPDKKDVPYFALALCLKCPIWSNEKRLKEQKEVLVYATHELIRLFE